MTTLNLDALRDALDYLGPLENHSGQIVETLQPPLQGQQLLCEFGCANCSEVGTKNADEYGEVLVAIVEQARLLLAAYEALLSRWRGI
jgi:hypothetical protein